MKVYTDKDCNVLLEDWDEAPQFVKVDDIVNFRENQYGYCGPVIRINGPVEYYIASLIVSFGNSPYDTVCVDAGGRNFGKDTGVWAKRQDIKDEVEKWRPGYWQQLEFQLAKYQMNPDDLKPIIWKKLGFVEHEDIPKELKIVITGQVGFLFGEPIERFLLDLRALVGNSINVRIIHGAAPGADTIAAELAKKIYGEDHVLAYPANWQLLGLKAGPLRNSIMIAQEPSLVVAFYEKEGPLFSKGTNDCVKKAGQKGTPVLKYEHQLGWL